MSNKKKKYEGWRTTKKERLCYYTGDSGRFIGSQIITNFMTVFLLFQGINITALAGVTLAIKIIDAMDDVIFGFFVDRIRLDRFKRITGGGKYLPWYKLTFFLFPLATILFFLMPVSMSDTAKVIWFTVTYLLYDLTCTLSEVPVNSMVMTLTDNVDERNNILKIKGVMVTVLTIAFAALGLALISEHVGVPVRVVAIGAAVFSLALMIPMNFGVKEHNTELKNISEDEKEKRYSFRDMLSCVKTNKYMAIILISTIFFTCLNTATSVQLFVSFYIFNDSLILIYPMVTNSAYADEIGLHPCIGTDRIKCVIIDDAPMDTAKMNWIVSAMYKSWFGTTKIKNTVQSKQLLCRDWVTGEYPPSFLTAGNDGAFPEDMKELFDALKSAGAITEYYYVEPEVAKEPHGYLNNYKTDDGAAKGVEFMLSFAKKYTYDVKV